DRVLAADEGCAAGRAALLGVIIGERHPFFADAVDVGGSVAHHALAIAADVPHADVVAPHDQDIGFVRLGHAFLLSVSGRLRPRLATRSLPPWRRDALNRTAPRRRPCSRWRVSPIVQAGKMMWKLIRNAKRPGRPSMARTDASSSTAAMQVTALFTARRYADASRRKTML